MIIRIIAKALVQCSTRTQAGWIALAVVAGAAGCSLTVMLDMIRSVAEGDCHYLRTIPGFVTAIPCTSFTRAGHLDHEKASRGCPGSLRASGEGSARP